MTNLRIGHGYDVHRLKPGRRLVLGGVEISWEKGLLGHSDADVLTHAAAGGHRKTVSGYRPVLCGHIQPEAPGESGTFSAGTRVFCGEY